MFWIERLGEFGARWAAVRLAGALLRDGASPECAEIGAPG